MKERPIIFNTENVKAILEGRKTQTRRVIKPQPDKRCAQVIHDSTIGWRFRYSFNKQCPYGQVGDRLWVRETWFPNHFDWRERQNVADIDYKADHDGKGSFYEDGDPSWRPSIFMPRWASRITLEITEIRVERLQEISQTDIKSEGIIAAGPVPINTARLLYKAKNDAELVTMVFRDEFAALWDSLNPKYPWESNPWVWVITFKQV